MGQVCVQWAGVALVALSLQTFGVGCGKSQSTPGPQIQPQSGPPPQIETQPQSRDQFTGQLGQRVVDPHSIHFNAIQAPHTLVSTGVKSVFALGSEIFVAGKEGIGVSSEGLTHFDSLTGLKGHEVGKIYVEGSTVVAYDPESSSGVWASTDSGKTFHHAMTEQGLPSSKVLSVLQHSKQILVGTDQGLVISEDGGQHFKPLHPPTGADRLQKTAFQYLEKRCSVRQIVAEQNNLSIATDQGLFLSHDSGKSLSWMGTDQGLGNADVYSLARIGSRLLVGTSDGLYYSDDQGVSFKQVHSNQNSTSFVVSGIWVDGKTVVARVSQKGLLLSQDSGVTFHTTSVLAPFGGEQVSDVALANSRIFAAMEANGLYVSEDSGATFQHLEGSHGLSGGAAGNDVRDLDGDETSLFIVTGAGLFVSEEGLKSFKKLGIQTGLGNFSLHRVIVKDQRVFVGHSHGLSISVDRGATFQTVVPDSTHPEVQEVQVMESGAIFVILADGRLLGSAGAGAQFSEQAGYASDARATALYQKGSSLYVGSSSGLWLSQDDGKQFKKIPVPMSGTEDFVKKILATDQFIAVATRNGLYISKDQGLSFQEMKDDQNRSLNEIESLEADSSNLWVGKYGLLALPQGSSSFFKLSSDQGIENHGVRKILRLGSHLYLATAGGVYFSQY